MSVIACVFGDIERLWECEPRKGLVSRGVMRRKLNENQILRENASPVLSKKGTLSVAYSLLRDKAEGNVTQSVTLYVTWILTLRFCQRVYVL